jgi:hypothetical protein
MILAWQIDLTFVVPALPRQPKRGAHLRLSLRQLLGANGTLGTTIVSSPALGCASLGEN